MPDTEKTKAVCPPDIPPQPAPPPDLERQKLEGEIAKLAAEKKKLDQESDRLTLDREYLPSTRRLEWVKAYGSAAAVIVGIAAIVTLFVNIQAYSNDSKRRTVEHVSTLLKDLGAPAPATRSAAAISLAPYFANADTTDELRGTLTAGLASALSIEIDFLVQRALASSLQQAGGSAIKPIQQSLRNTISELVPLFDQLGHSAQPDAPEPGGSNSRNEQEKRIRGRQYAVVAMALLLRDLVPCTPAKGCARCRPDFGDFPLRGFSFVGLRDDICGARFTGASLASVDFYDQDLRSADFSNAAIHGASFANAKLAGADFSSAQANFDNEAPTRRTFFGGADLAGAKFDGACLAATTFRDAKSLVPQQFANAFLEGAQLDASFETELRRQRLLRGDPTKCPKLGRTDQ